MLREVRQQCSPKALAQILYLQFLLPFEIIYVAAKQDLRERQRDLEISSGSTRRANILPREIIQSRLAPDLTTTTTA